MTHKSSAGFTLIELLVVLVIIALFLSMAVLSIGDSLQRDMRAEIERLQSIFIAMADDAVYSGSQYGVYLSNNSYMVLQYNILSAAWVMPTKKLYLPYSIPESMRIEWSVEGFTVPDSDDQVSDLQIAFGGEDTDNDASLFANENVEDDQEVLELSDYSPQIYALSSGETTVFTVTFKAQSDISSNVAYELASDGFSMPTVTNLDNQNDNNRDEIDERF